MTDAVEAGITRDAVAILAQCTDPRLKLVSEALVRHAHAFVQEVRLTENEWRAAIRFLTRAGQMCDDNRQEFILLSDIFGVSILVDAINHANANSTEATVLGPFYTENPPVIANGDDISGGMEGPRLWVQGSVRSREGGPVAGAMIDVWQSDSDGLYDVQRDLGTRGRARLYSDAAGKFSFWTKLPASYPIPYDGPVGELLDAQGRHPFRPAHIHFMFKADGHEKLTTQIYAQDDVYLGSDPVFGVKESLTCDFVRQAPGVAPDGSMVDAPWHSLAYDFVLVPADAAHA